MANGAHRLCFVTGFGTVALAAGAVLADTNQIVSFTDPSGLSAQAEFTILDSTTLQVRLRNTSTGVPEAFSNADQLLTGVSWDLGEPGPFFLDPLITGGFVQTGPESFSMNFSQRNVGPGEDISGEYGFSNSNFTGMLQNFVTASNAQSTPFGGENLDGPVDITGPAGGLLSTELVPLDGIGAIQNEFVATLFLSMPIFDLNFLEANGTRVEFGDDAFHIDGVLGEPAPGALALFMLAGLAGARRRRD